MATLNNQSSELKLLYVKYKQVLLAVGVLFVSLILILQFLIPQIDDWNIQRQQLALQEKKIAVMNNNISYLNSINKTRAARDFKTAITALPPQKDYEGILSSISNSAASSSIQLNDYSFSVGDIATLSATQPKSSVGEIKINITFKGSVPDTKKFVDSIYSSFPMATISNVIVGETSGSLQIAFLYSALPKVVLEVDQPLNGLNLKEAKTLTEISSWNSNTEFNNQSDQSTSSNPNPFGSFLSPQASSSSQLGL